LKTAPLLKIFQDRKKVIDFEAKKGVKDYGRLKEMLVKMNL